MCGCYRMWGQPAGECWKLLLSGFSQRLLSVRSLCLEDFCHPWREGEWWLNEWRHRFNPTVEPKWSKLLTESMSVFTTTTVFNRWSVPVQTTNQRSALHLCLLSLRLFWTSPRWTSSGVTCAGTTTWRSETGSGEKLLWKVFSCDSQHTSSLSSEYHPETCHSCCVMFSALGTAKL